MMVTVLGMTVFLQPTTNLLAAVMTMALQLLRESNTGLLEATVICANSVQKLNAPVPTEATDAGISIEVRLLQKENA